MRSLRVRSLQARLVLVSVLLLAVTSVVVGAGAALALHGYLIGRLDEQVRDVVGFRADPPPGAPPDGPVGGPARAGEAVEVRTADGRVLTASRTDRRGSARPLAASAAAPVLAVVPGAAPVTVTLAGRDFRMGAARAVDGTVVVIGLDTDGVTDTVGRLVLVEAVIFSAGVAAAGLVSAWATRRALRPLREVSTTAGRVAELPLGRGEVELAERVPPELTDPRSEAGRVGAALNRMLGHVEAALAARQSSETRLRRFVADASHELRTPLAAIRGYAELAARRSGELPPDVVTLLDRVGSQTGRMTALVEDLLLLARLDAGRSLAREPVDLARVVAEAVADAHAAAPAHRWSLDLPEDPAVVTGDPDRLAQVVANLLANARVHTPPGTSVTARVRAGEQVVLDVVDDGPGVPESLRPHVFERFARGDAARTGPSTGLGLSIVAAVVAEHGGTIALADEPGATRFRVLLPAGELPSRP